MGIREYIYAFLAVVVLGIAGTTGYKIGEWKQASADSAELNAAKTALATNAKDVAEAEKSARAQADAAYKDEIQALKDREAFSSDLAKQLQTDNARLNKKLYDMNKAVEAAKHDPDAKRFLDAPIPAAIRDGLRNAAGEAGRLPGGAGDRSQ